MVILSISMNEAILKEIDALMEEFGYSGRSEIIRGAVRGFIEEKKGRELEGKIEGVLIVVHADRADIDISKIAHEFEDVVKTQVHNHLDKGKCCEIYMVKGDALRVKKMVNQFEVKGKAEVVKLVVA